MSPVLFVVIPCYNEEAVLPETRKRLADKLDRMTKGGVISPDSRVLMVDDGSRDKTWQLIEDFYQQDKRFGGIKLAHNRGHQHALLAGLMTANGHCDCAISMDADLQDDIEVMDQFIQKYQEGCEVVYGVRKKRTTDTAFKRNTAQAFYKFMNKMGAKVVYNHADYRLLGSRALEALSEYREVNLFLRGIVPDIGYKTAVVYYDRAERFAGEYKYPLSKMIGLAVDGITSFSIRPLETIVKAGALISFLCILALIASLILAIWHVGFSGWMALVASIWLIGGIVMTSVGIVGIYVGKAYGESKHRPRWHIEEQLLDTGEEKNS